MSQTVDYGGSVAVAAPPEPGTVELAYGGVVRVEAVPAPGSFTVSYGGTTRVAGAVSLEPFTVTYGGAVRVASSTPGAERSVEILRVGDRLVEVPLLVKVGGQLVDPVTAQPWP